MKFTFGTDPEFFLSKNDKIYSAIGIVKGTKDRRKKIGNCAFYYDNVLAECAIPPGKSKKETLDNIRDCLKKYANLVAPYKLETKASHVFAPDQLRHEAAREVGCSPESCAYLVEDLQPNEELFLKNNLRSAGGHIHLGSTLLKEGFNSIVSILLLDLFLGIPSIFIDHDPTTKKRKELYGQAGRWRYPEYGVEYRSVGNFWLSSPQLVDLVYDICQFVLNFIEDGRWKLLWHIDEDRLKSDEAWSDPDFHPNQCYRCIGYNAQDLRKSIDGVDLILGERFLDFIEKLLPNEIYSRIIKFSTLPQFDFYKEWELT
ncbi:MAG: hypothetical protein ACHQUC_07070 [Chlamydiales bacterium]